VEYVVDILSKIKKSGSKTRFQKQKEKMKLNNCFCYLSQGLVLASGLA